LPKISGASPYTYNTWACTSSSLQGPRRHWHEGPHQESPIDLPGGLQVDFSKSSL
jgi:hypothetical protein